MGAWWGQDSSSKWWCPADPTYVVPDNTTSFGENDSECMMQASSGLVQAEHTIKDDPEAQKQRIIHILSVRTRSVDEHQSELEETTAAGDGNGSTAAHGAVAVPPLSHGCSISRVHLGLRVDPTSPDHERFLLRVHFPDGSFHTVTVEVEDEEMHIRHVIAKKIGLSNPEAFRLAEVPDAQFGDVNELLPEDCPLAMLAEKAPNWCGWLVLRRKIGSSVEDLKDDVAIRLSYMQAVQEFVCGEYSCSPRDAFKLASLQFRICFGAYNPDIHAPQFLMNKVGQLLPRFILHKYQEMDWAEQIIEGVQRLWHLEQCQLEEMGSGDDKSAMDQMFMTMYLQQVQQIAQQKLLIRVYLADGAFKTLPCDRNTVAGQLCAQIGAKLGMTEAATALFCLYESADNSKIRVLQKESKLVFSSDGETNTPHYIFKRADPFSSIEEVVQDAAAVHLSYIQAAANYKTGLYACSIPDAMFLSALVAVIENHASSSGLTIYDLRMILPANLYDKQATKIWAKDLDETVKGIGQLEFGDAEIKFLRYIREQVLQVGSTSGLVGLKMENERLHEVIDSVPPIHPGPVFGW